LEKGSDKFLPVNFVSEMKRIVDDYHLENKGVIEILQTPFQADPEIATQMVCGDAD